MHRRGPKAAARRVNIQSEKTSISISKPKKAVTIYLFTRKQKDRKTAVDRGTDNQHPQTKNARDLSNPENQTKRDTKKPARNKAVPSSKVVAKGSSSSSHYTPSFPSHTSRVLSQRRPCAAFSCVMVSSCVSRPRNPQRESKTKKQNPKAPESASCFVLSSLQKSSCVHRHSIRTSSKFVVRRSQL